jgi:hypothetical protein
MNKIYIFTMSCSVLLKMRSVLDKSCRENQNTHFRLNNFFRISCRLLDKMEKYCTPGGEGAMPQITLWSMRIACCIPKATDTVSDYVLRLAFPLQQLLHASASMLRDKCIACLLYTIYSNNCITVRYKKTIQSYSKHPTCFGFFRPSSERD